MEFYSITKAAVCQVFCEKINLLILAFGVDRVGGNGRCGGFAIRKNQRTALQKKQKLKKLKKFQKY